jgi:hypothetical protein
MSKCEKVVQNLRMYIKVREKGLKPEKVCQNLRKWFKT